MPDTLLIIKFGFLLLRFDLAELQLELFDFFLGLLQLFMIILNRIPTSQGILRWILAYSIFFLMILLRIKHLLFLFFSPHSFDQLMIVGLCVLFEQVNGFYAFAIILHHLYPAHLLVFFSLPLLLRSLLQFLLGLQPILHTLADQRIRGGSLDVVDIETPEVLLIFGGQNIIAGLLGMDYILLSNSRVVPQSLKMLFVCWLKELLSLRQLSHLQGRFAIFESTVRDITLLVEGVGSIVGGAVELSSHHNKIIEALFQSELQ